jgi:hypothetical protein
MLREREKYNFLMGGGDRVFGPKNRPLCTSSYDLPDPAEKVWIWISNTCGRTAVIG